MYASVRFCLAGAFIAACVVPSGQPTPPASADPTPTPAAAAAPRGSAPLASEPGVAPSPGAERVPRQIGVVQQLSASTGWAIVADGPASALWRTVDTGATWTRLAVLPYTRIDQLRFIDERTGWALAFGLREEPQTGCLQASSAPPCRSAVLTTRDGGASWESRLTIPVDLGGAGPAAIRQLQAVDAEHAWVIAQYGECGHDGCLQQEIRATADAGRTWRSLYRPDARGLVPTLLRMADRNVGWMVALRAFRGGEVVLGTGDGGRTWRELRQTTGAVAIDAASERDAWILTRDAAFCSSSGCTRYELLRTRDGGTTWTSMGDPVAQACAGGHLRGPLFASPQVGYLGLDLGAGGLASPGGVMVSRDGGGTWACSRAPRNVTAVSAADPDHAWAISLDRDTGTTRIFRTADAGLTWAPVLGPP